MYIYYVLKGTLPYMDTAVLYRFNSHCFYIRQIVFKNNIKGLGHFWNGGSKFNIQPQKKT